MRKRIVSLFLTLCMVTSMITAMSTTVSAATSGTCGDNLTWTLDDEGTLIISGTGDMTGWNGNGSPWYSNKTIKKVEIKQGITNIGSYAFAYCSSLSSISIPDSVIYIGSYAFAYCRSLSSISIPDSVTSIGSYAFEECSSLVSIEVSVNHPYYRSINGNLYNKSRTTLIQYAIGKKDISFNIPDGVTSVGRYAFADCKSLSSISIPNGVTSIGRCAFAYCSSLSSISIPDSVIYIGGWAFTNCSSLTSISLPNGVTSIGEFAFQSCSRLTSISIPSSITSIDDNVFYLCSNLTRVSISDGVTSIGGWAFAWCVSLSSISIPDSVTSIDKYVFYNCGGLKDIYYSGSPEQWKKINIGNYNSELTNAKIHYNSIGPSDSTTVSAATSGTCGDNLTWTLDDEGTLIISGTGNMWDWNGNGSPWYSNKTIKKVEVKQGVTSIGSHAFGFCSSLTSISIPDSVTSIGSYAFEVCSSLTSISLPNSVASIGSYTFCGCSSLTSISLPDSVTSIGEWTFGFCSSLASISIPNSVTSIGNGVFHNCGGLKDVYYSGSQEQWNKISIGVHNDNLTNAKIHYNSIGPGTTNYTNNTGVHLWLDGNANREMYLTPGRSYEVNIRAYPVSAYPTNGVTWHSTNPDVATVSQKGIITGLKGGHTNVYITTADGIISDILPVAVTDLSKLTPSASKKISKLDFDSNYNWVVTNNNFLYWNAFVQNDTNAAKYYFQNYLCAPLFDISELKNLYSGVCSKDRAKEILLSFIAETYDGAYEKIKKDASYKLADKVNSNLGKWLEQQIDNDYGTKLNNLGEETIQKVFDGCDLDTGIKSLSNYLDPDNPEQARALISNWVLTDAVGDLFSTVSKVIDITNDMGAIKNELMQLQIAAQTNDSYVELLDYLANNCIDRNVRFAAYEIRERMKRATWQNIGALAADMAVKKSVDSMTKEMSKKAFSKITGSSLAIKIGYEMGIFVSNELLHASDSLKCSDNIRLLSYISVAMTNKIASLHLAFVTTTDEVQKENYAKQLIEQYNLLISARKLGEENYSKVYKYNPANWETIRTIFGMKYNDIDIWYDNVSAYLDKAKGNPEAKCDYVAVTSNGNGGGTFSLSGTSAVVLQSNGSGTAYTAEEFYGLFADKAFADAVLFSLGADKENPDWSIVTKEAVEGLTAVYCDEDRTVSDITGVSNLKSLKYLNLANQNVRILPDEITQLSDLELINLFNNGITVYPSVLNDMSSLKQAVLSYNLLTDVSDISDRITVELSGNLLDNGSYQQQRYLYSDMPIIYSADTKLTDVIKLRDMYGIVYDYNGDEPQTEGNLSDGSITAAVNGSSNPNARIKILADILDTSAYTEASFNAVFPDSNVRAGVLAALSMDSESVDYSKITQAALAGISQCTITGAEDLTGIELLKGLNSLDLEQSAITSVPIVLEQLNNLQQLTFRGAALTSLDGLLKIKNLTQLDISQCTGLTDVSELKALTKLEKLYADEAGNANILNEVAALSNIKTLSVFGNCITDISPIMDNNYDYLNISGNLIDEDIFNGDEFRALQNNCGMIVYSPQNTGLIKNITASENRIVVTVENNTGTIFENIDLYTAIYRDDRLVEVKKNDISVLGGYDDQTFDMAFEELKDRDSVKCFIWVENMQQPVTVSKSTQIIK